jgi:hypothetical protein
LCFFISYGAWGPTVRIHNHFLAQNAAQIPLDPWGSIGLASPGRPKNTPNSAGHEPKELSISNFVLEFTSEFQHKILKKKFLRLISWIF